MHRLMRKCYGLLTAAFILALVYAFGGRTWLPRTVKPVLDPASFAAISGWVVVNALLFYRHHFRFRDLQLEQIDTMEGPVFEEFCAYLLKRNGFKHIQVTKQSGDQGIDVIGTKKKAQVGFQCKRYEGVVGNKAVQEAWAGQSFYKLDQAAVITNSEFSDSAQQLAEELGVMLIDRKQLKRLMRRLPN
nr:MULTISPECIES: restriction endonuclease [Lacticaseibacillus]